MADIVYHYNFELEDGKEKVFEVRLDERTLDVVRPLPESPPEWTRLSCCQCPNCPLQESEHPHCPIALNLVDLAELAIRRRTARWMCNWLQTSASTPNTPRCSRRSVPCWASTW